MEDLVLRIKDAGGFFVVDFGSLGEEEEEVVGRSPEVEGEKESLNCGGEDGVSGGEKNT